MIVRLPTSIRQRCITTPAFARAVASGRENSGAWLARELSDFDRVLREWGYIR